MATNVLFLSLDGAEPALLQQWAAAGELPAIRELLVSWQYYDIDTPRGFGDGVFWTSLYTGCNAGKHGHYFPLQFSPKTYGIEKFRHDTDFRKDPFWMFASKMGQRVGIIDLYTSPLVQGLDGVQVMDWMIHDRTEAPRSWPEPVMDALHEQYMKDPLEGNSEALDRSESEWKALHDGMLNRISAKTEALCGMLSGNHWNLFAANYCDAHDAGHQSWHWHDSSAPDHPEKWAGRYGNPLLQVYKALDKSVQRVVSSANAKHNFLVAGIGMGMQTTCNPVFDQVLGWFSGHTGTRAELEQQRSTRPWFAVPHNMNSGAVRINLKGRERNGMVEPEDYDQVCDNLEIKLSDLVDTDSAQPVVSSVVRIRREYEGDFTDQLPDMMVVWQRDRRVSGVRIDGKGTLSIVPGPLVEGRSGDHTPNAMLLCNRSLLDGGGNKPVNIPTESIAPTIGRSLGLRFPGMDGRPFRLAP